MPATTFLKESGLPITGRGEVLVDKVKLNDLRDLLNLLLHLFFFFPLQYMKAADSVFAAGDIVRFPLPLIDGETNIGHWQIAHNHGQFSLSNTGVVCTLVNR